MRGIRELDTQPMFMTVQTNETSAELIRRIPALGDLPLVRIHSAEPTNLLGVLDWQRVVIRRIIKHYFNSFIYLHVTLFHRFCIFYFDYGRELRCKRG